VGNNTLKQNSSMKFMSRGILQILSEDVQDGELVGLVEKDVGDGPLAWLTIFH
jgi:hypothetical protein